MFTVKMNKKTVEKKKKECIDFRHKNNTKNNL